jgi:hypothetical protein
VVLYEIITGRIPFEGKNANATLYAIIANEPPPLVMFASGDDELWTILSIGLAKDPDKRWQAMRTLGEALARWLRARGVNEDVTGAALDAAWRPGGDRLDSLSTMPPQVALAEATERAIGTTTRIERTMQPLSRRVGRAVVVGGSAIAVFGGILWWTLTEEPPARPVPIEPVAAPSLPAPPEEQRAAAKDKDTEPAPIDPSSLATLPEPSASAAPDELAGAAAPRASKVKKTRTRGSAGPARAPSGPLAPMKDPFR